MRKITKNQWNEIPNDEKIIRNKIYYVQSMTDKGTKCFPVEIVEEKKSNCIDLASEKYFKTIEDKNYILSYDKEKKHTVLKPREYKAEPSKLKKFDAHIILSKKQIILMQLYGGSYKEDALHMAFTLFLDSEYEKTVFKDFQCENTGLADDLHLVLNLGFEALAKMYNTKIEEDERYVGYLEL